VLVSPSVDAVVRDVQPSLREPLNVSGLERTSLNSRVGAVPAFGRDGRKGRKRSTLSLVSRGRGRGRAKTDQ
jgi:hypothetical protein